MNKQLESIFNLPERPSQQEFDWPKEMTDEDHIKEYTDEALTNLEKIEQALPIVRGLENSDKEFDELANMAIDSYKDLMDLGQNVDSRFSAEIFSVAGNFMNHAIAAKVAKTNAKLKRVEAQLKKAALDQRAMAKSTEIENTQVGEGRTLDRNELLRILNEKK